MMKIQEPNTQGIKYKVVGAGVISTTLPFTLEVCWNFAKDYLPWKSGLYLVLDQLKDYGIIYFDVDRKSWWDKNMYAMVNNVVAWMPLPEREDVFHDETEDHRTD